MKRYPEYKDSGVEYLGEIPSNWKALRIKFVSQINPNKDDSLNKDSEELVTFLPMECVNADGSISTIQKKPIKSLCTGFTFFRKDDIIFAKITPCFENGKGALLTELETEFGFGSTEFHVLRVLPDICNNEFLYFYTRSPLFRDIGEAFMSGSAGQKRVPTDFIENFYIPISSLKEQKQIASFLGNKTSQIDSLISKKKRMIDLLKEERAAIINHAVTKGINPDAEMKDSGVEWLGEVPKHWEVKRLKFICEGKLMYGANESADSDDPNQPRYIRITDFGDDGKLRNETFKSLPAEIAKPYLLKDGDILFARSGATVGKTFQFKNYSGKACFAGYLIKAAPNETIVTTDFFYLFTKSSIYDNWKNSIFIQATIQNIGADKYNNFILCLPPIKEQNFITSYLNQKTYQIDASITHIEKEISLIEEYRTALINETVTGKIDIRDRVKS